MRFIRDTERNGGNGGVFCLFTALLAAASLLVAGCAEAGDSDPGGSGARSSSVATGAEEVGFGETLAQIRGHLAASLELYSDDDAKGASVHAGHPVEELMTSVRTELDEHGSAAGAELQTALEENLQAIARGVSVAQLSTRYERVAAVTEEAEAAGGGEGARAQALVGSLGAP